MDVYSELKQAQLEVLSADPAPTTRGRIYHKNALRPLMVTDELGNNQAVLTELNMEDFINPLVNTGVGNLSNRWVAVNEVVGFISGDRANQIIGSGGFHSTGERFDGGATVSFIPFAVDSSSYPAIPGKKLVYRLHGCLFCNAIPATSGTYNVRFGLVPVTDTTITTVAAPVHYLSVVLGTVITNSMCSFKFNNQKNYISSGTSFEYSGGLCMVGIEILNNFSPTSSFAYRIQLQARYVDA